MIITDLSTYPFNTIKLGNVFKTKGIFKGVSDESLEWRLVETTKSTFKFEITYYGIWLTDAIVSPSENFKIQYI